MLLSNKKQQTTVTHNIRVHLRNTRLRKRGQAQKRTYVMILLTNFKKKQSGSLLTELEVEWLPL